jgi:RIO-like serine/threonine protein kinase
VQLTGPGGQRHATPRSSLETPSWPTEFEFKAPAGWRGEISLALFRRRRGVTDLLGHASFPLTDFKSLEDHPVLLTKVKGGGEVRVVVSIFEDQREVEERYELVEKLGVGGTSVVHKAVDKETGQEVAVKVMARGEQSKAEAELMSRLSHPNIVQFHRSHTTRQSEYIVMEVMQGGELYSKVSGCGPLSEHLAALYTHQVLDALAYAHSLGITHGDIKPENILLHSDGLLVKIADFGESTAAASLTPCLYSPPEIVAGGALAPL